MNSERIVILSYLAVLALQVVWHALLPEPLGKQNWILAAVALFPLLFPLAGILAKRGRSMTWGAYLLVLYFIIAIMEIWSNPSERIPAIVQLILTVSYFTALVQLTRAHRQPS